MTQDEKIITEEQIKKDDERFNELNKKDALTPEEKTELNEVKERYGKRMQQKINKMTSETKTEREARIKAEEEAETLRKENEELKKGKQEPIVSVKEEFVKVGDKQFYTNDTLVKMIEAGKMTETEAYNYQRARDREEDRLIIRHDIEKEKQQSNVNQIRFEDAQQVIKEYPHFNKAHPDFNPEDPLYKKTQEIYMDGYAANPRGLSKSIKLAKEVLRISDTHADISGQHQVEDGGAPESHAKKEKEITLSEDEKDAGERMYRDQINPKTGRTYTPNESHTKALEAKKRRLNKE